LLLKMADRIEKYRQKETLTERQSAQYEHDLFIGCYSVRKLFESTAKVSDETRATKMSLDWFPKKPDAPIVDCYNRSEFWELYDLEDRHNEQRDALFVAHRPIHSFIVVGSAAFEGDMSGDLFTSDRDKEEWLYFIPTYETVALFSAVERDYPGFVTWRDEKTGKRLWKAPASKGSVLDG
ncbi:hypothetical protein, partial [Gluconobacter oxydans]|uniref:hypothetical protein n=3 Tax=Acetobacteraceae TaxID=433 RepID=UPI001CD8A599